MDDGCEHLKPGKKATRGASYERRRNHLERVQIFAKASQTVVQVARVHALSGEVERHAAVWPDNRPLHGRVLCSPRDEGKGSSVRCTRMYNVHLARIYKTLKRDSQAGRG